MDAEPRLGLARFVVAALVAAAFVLSAPVAGGLRSQLRTSFPQQFVWIVGSAIAALVAAGIVTALLRIRERRRARYGAMALSLAGAVAFARWHATGRAEIDVVELFHFVEYGIITFLFYRAWKPADDGSALILPVLAGLLVGTCEEWLQWFIPVRVGEMADVFLNLAAILCGVVFSVAADPPAHLTFRLRPGSPRRIARIAALVVLVFALFFQFVHMGFSVSDDEIGSFDSRYPKAKLQALQLRKREEWRTHPLPLELHRISREDQYMSEGVVHVQERNRAWAAGDALTAWRENQILEHYYQPVLDTPSYVSKTGHRWPPEQRSDAQAKAAAVTEAAPFVSRAYPYPIYTWPATMFWGVVGMTIGALLTLSSGR
jgi:VanZ family protein